jgi:hypothetical protein
MPQVKDSNGNVVADAWYGFGPGQVVAYTGTAGTIANGLGTAISATATLTSNNTNVSANDTVTIGGKVYTFVSPVGTTEGNVLIGADADASLLNLIRAINHSGTPDTDYKCAAANANVTAAASVTAHAFVVSSIVVPGLSGNEITISKSAVTLTWSPSTTLLTLGVQARDVRFVRVFTTTIAHIAIGASPTATARDCPLPASVPTIFPCAQGDKVSAVQSAAGGNLHVVELI